MNLSQADYALQYEACEAEELRFTGFVQSGFDVFTIDAAGAMSATPGLAAMTPRDFAAIRDAKVIEKVGLCYDRLDTGAHGIWLHHTKSGVDIFERALTKPSTTPPTDFDWNLLVKRSNGNLWKLNANVCTLIQQAVNCQRAMIYRFHEDWSGEVVAESVVDGLDRYLGLHYPPTDVPAQARKIFEETGTRHIFSTHRTDQPLVPLDGKDAPVDLTHAISRSVSPYHLEYLRNMGTASTASCALLHEGRLWGLVSVHYTSDRAPNIDEVAVLQNFVREFQPILHDTLENERNNLGRRSAKLIAKQREMLVTDGDVLRTLLLSPTSIHRLVGGQGCALVVDHHQCSVGSVPTNAAISHLCQTVGQELGPMETTFVDHMPEACVDLGCGDVAGFALTRISDGVDAFAIVFRDSVTQTVTWGGDPRRSAQPMSSGRVSPRKSFEQWVEEVEGRALPWTNLQKETLADCLQMALSHFEVSLRELAVLIRNSILLASQNPETLREKSKEAVESIHTAMAFGLEIRAEEQTQIFALNASASDAFDISSVEVDDMTLDDLEAIIGVELSDVSGPQVITGVATTNRGIRDCEVSRTLLFDYANQEDPTSNLRIEAFELQDVTEKRRIEAALVTARDNATREIALREESFARLNHELRTPLNVVIGLSSLILGPEASGLNPKTFKKLSVIKDASEHLHQILEMGLQNGSTLQGGDDDEFSVCAVSALVSPVIDLLKMSADTNEVELTFDGDKNLSVFVEPRAARQIIINIVSNAIKYNVPRGKVHISASRHTADFIRIDVADNGIGMTKDQVDQCIKPYQRFAGGEGAGLGLSIAQHLISSIGGLLTIQSEQGVGTTVSVLLPPPRAKGLQGLTESPPINPASLH